MKLKFEESKDPKGFAIVKEDGINTDKVTFETVGIISYVEEEPVLFSDEDFSGILHLGNLKEIVAFMEDKLK